jgi:hypothetical protein
MLREYLFEDRVLVLVVNRVGFEVGGEEDKWSCLRLRVKLSRVESSQRRIESGSGIEDCMGGLKREIGLDIE